MVIFHSYVKLPEGNPHEMGKKRPKLQGVEKNRHLRICIRSQSVDSLACTKKGTLLNITPIINGRSPGSEQMEVRNRTICWVICCGDMHLHRPLKKALYMESVPPF